MTIFPDTNALLHYPSVKDVDWPKVAGATAVRLVLCMQVIHELDEKKNDPTLARRAERVIKEIRTIDHSGQPVRQNVTLEILNRELKASDFPDSLSIDSKDDRIVHSVKKYIEISGDSAVAVYTEDLGMMLRCKANGIAVIEPDKATRLESPQSEQEKKYRAALTELNQLKNRLPDLRLAATLNGRTDPNDEAILQEGQPDLFDPRQQVEAQRQRFPFMQPTYGELLPAHRALGHLNVISKEDREEYNRQLDRFFKEYERYVEQVNDTIRASQRLLQISVMLRNDGSAPAEDIDVHVVFPDIFSVIGMADSNEVKLFRRPPAPQPPERPKSQMERLGESANLPFEFAQFGRRDDEPDKIVISHLSDGSHEFHATVSRLKHFHHVELGTVFAVPRTWDDVRPFETVYWISVGNHPQRTEGKLVLKVRRVRP